MLWIFKSNIASKMEGDNTEAAGGSSYPLYGLGAVDESALWLGGNDNLEGGWGSIGSLESGGALLSSGCWSISTEPGEEGLKWNGVKTELFSGASGGFMKSADTPRNGLPGISKKAPSTTCLGTVKQESEQAWQSSVNDFPRTAGVTGDAVVGAKSTANSPPRTHPLAQRLPSTGSLQGTCSRIYNKIVWVASAFHLLLHVPSGLWYGSKASGAVHFLFTQVCGLLPWAVSYQRIAASKQRGFFCAVISFSCQRNHLIELKSFE